MASYLRVRSKLFDQKFQTACSEPGVRRWCFSLPGWIRTHQLDWPADTHVIEIDHSNVLEFKDHVLVQQSHERTAPTTSWGRICGRTGPAALQQTGFDPTAPTAWLAEGLLLLLPDEEATQLLCPPVLALSALGSRWPAIESIAAHPTTGMTSPAGTTILQRMSTMSGADPAGLWPPSSSNGTPSPGWWRITSTPPHTHAHRYERELDGHRPFAEAQHPNVLLSVLAR